MKILVVCQYYYPENFQITPICEQLVENGHEVTVLTGLPNYPTGIVPAEYKHGHRNEIINGVNVIRCNEIGRKKGAVGLALNYISFLQSAKKKIMALPPNYDLVFIYQLSPVLMGIPAVKYSKHHNLPIILYCCDLWPESMKMYIGEKNPIFNGIAKISNNVYSSCDRIICQSSSFISYFERFHKIPEKKLTYIPAFADEAYLHEDFTNEDQVVDFVFLGNLGIAQNLISVLKAIEMIKDVPNFKVHFVGDGSALEDMKKFVCENHLENIVCFYGRKPVEEMQKFYRLADACMVSLKADSEVGLTLPTKVQGYMAAGKPIIGMINGSAKKVIDESECGICVEADDIEGLARAMKCFIENKDIHRLWGENARKYFTNNFRKKVIMEHLDTEFTRILSKRENDSI